MAVDYSKLGTISGKRYGEPRDDPECVCGFEKVLSAGKLIEFGDRARPVMDCIEQLSIRRLFFSRMVSLFYVTKLITELVIGQENPSVAQVPW